MILFQRSRFGDPSSVCETIDEDTLSSRFTNLKRYSLYAGSVLLYGTAGSAVGWMDAAFDKSDVLPEMLGGFVVGGIIGGVLSYCIDKKPWKRFNYSRRKSHEDSA